jgi:hypothetical protein
MGFWKKEKSFIDPNSGARVTWWGSVKQAAGKAADVTYATVEQAISAYLQEDPQTASFLEKNNATLSVSALPDKYDNTPYQTVVNGKWVKTVGEYKAECRKSEWDHIAD